MAATIVHTSQFFSNMFGQYSSTLVLHCYPLCYCGTCASDSVLYFVLCFLVFSGVVVARLVVAISFFLLIGGCGLFALVYCFSIQKRGSERVAL